MAIKRNSDAQVEFCCKQVPSKAPALTPPPSPPPTDPDPDGTKVCCPFFTQTADNEKDKCRNGHLRQCVVVREKNWRLSSMLPHPVYTCVFYIALDFGSTYLAS